MQTMPSTRSKSASNESNKVKKIITRRTKYIDLFDFHEIQYCCSNCKNIVDIHTFSCSKTVQCLQPWNESFAINVSKTLFHLNVCDYSKTNTFIPIEFEYYIIKNNNQHITSLLNNCSIHYSI